MIIIIGNQSKLSLLTQTFTEYCCDGGQKLCTIRVYNYVYILCTANYRECIYMEAVYMYMLSQRDICILLLYYN